MMLLGHESSVLQLKYKYVGHIVMGSLENCAFNDVYVESGNCVRYVHLFNEKAAVTLKSSALAAFPEHVMQINCLEISGW